jgi:trypsin
VIFGRSNLANNNGQSIPKGREFEHPDYEPSRSDNDFGLVILAEEVSNARIVRLNEVHSYPSVGAVVTVAGWGDTTESDGQSKLSNKMMRVNVNTISNADCEDSTDGRGLDYFDQITKNMLCATVDGGGKDACQVSIDVLTEQKILALSP